MVWAGVSTYGRPHRRLGPTRSLVDILPEDAEIDDELQARLYEALPPRLGGRAPLGSDRLHLWEERPPLSHVELGERGADAFGAEREERS